MQISKASVDCYDFNIFSVIKKNYFKIPILKSTLNDYTFLYIHASYFASINRKFRFPFVIYHDPLVPHKFLEGLDHFKD